MNATETPRIYVASLSDYNAGRLVGAWIDLDETTDADTIHEAVQDMLKTSPEPIAEEWAIHDYEGFGDIHLDEYESFDRVAALAAALAEHGDAFAAWASDSSWNAEHPDKFQGAYEGHYESVKDYAYEYAESTGLMKSLEDLGIECHVDWESYGNDLLQDYTVIDAPDGGIYVFDLR